MTRPPKDASISRIQRVKERVLQLRKIGRDSPEFDKWHRDTRVAIANVFGEDSAKIDDFTNIRFRRGKATYAISESTIQKAYVASLQRAEYILESMIEEVQEYWPDTSTGIDSSVAAQHNQGTVTNKIFLIHGRDIGARETVARFLDTLGIEAIILQEQPDEGQTIIEKFERYAEVNFALALFTPDDVGGLEDDALKPRSRQNVIFEFGYFIGKYERNRVRALVKGNIEIPSDYSGVLYIQLDESERWKMDLIRELKSAGFEIDANRAFE